MTAAVIQFTPLRGMQCSSCGASATASCDCGASYVPAGERAAAAVAANPDMSDRAIADEIGVSHTTVQKARKTTGNQGASSKRTGKDGKKRKQPKKRKKTTKDDVVVVSEAHGDGAVRGAGLAGE